MFNAIRADIQRIAPCSWPLYQRLRQVCGHYGFHALVVYRLGQWLYRHRHHLALWPFAPLLWPIYWLLSLATRKAYGIHLCQSARIGPGLKIGHVGGIILRHCQLGHSCTISQQVKIMPTAGSSQGPRLGNRVWIGANASIIGDITLEQGATLAAGSPAHQNIAAHHLVGGNPARVINPRFDNSHLIN